MNDGYMLDSDTIQKYQEELNLAQQQASMNAPQRDLTASQLREQEKSLMKEQLSLGQELDTIYNLLQGKILEHDEEGNIGWKEPEDKSMIILTPYGVHLIMNTIQFYLNKNTLLSNYDEETILHKMEDFSTDLVDTVFMEYEKVFRTPTLEECKKVLQERIEKKKELRKFAYELIGREVNEEEIERGFIEEIETKIEKEIQKIKEQIVKNNLKRFLILIRVIQDTVHSTYLRAWNGQERRTIRQHISVTENIGSNNYLPQTKPKKSWYRLGR